MDCEYVHVGKRVYTLLAIAVPIFAAYNKSIKQECAKNTNHHHIVISHRQPHSHINHIPRRRKKNRHRVITSGILYRKGGGGGGQKRKLPHSLPFPRLRSKKSTAQVNLFHGVFVYKSIKFPLCLVPLPCFGFLPLCVNGINIAQAFVVSVGP